MTDSAGTKKAPETTITIVVVAPTGWMNDADNFVEKLNDTLQNSVETRMEWVDKNLDRIESRIADIRNYIKFDDEVMNKIEKQLARIEMQVPDLEAKLPVMQVEKKTPARSAGD